MGCVEVFESRGMQVCEEALKVLRVSMMRERRRAVPRCRGVAPAVTARVTDRPVE